MIFAIVGAGRKYPKAPTLDFVNPKTFLFNPTSGDPLHPFSINNPEKDNANSSISFKDLASWLNPLLDLYLKPINLVVY